MTHFKYTFIFPEEKYPFNVLYIQQQNINAFTSSHTFQADYEVTSY